MSATDSSLILKNHEGDKFFLTTTGNHGKFILDFTTEMGRRSLGTPLVDDDDYFPVRPDEAYHRRDGTLGYGIFSHHDQREISDYIRSRSIWDAQCEQVINFLRAALEELVRTTVETRVKDPWRGNRPCIRQVIAVLAQIYGDWSDLKGQRNYLQMATIDVFTSVESVQLGLASLDSLKLEREGWVNDPSPYGDRYYRSWLLQRMRQWDILVILRSSLILDDTLTFDECRKRLHLTIADKAQQKDEAVQRHRQITAHTDRSGCGIDSSITTLSTSMVDVTGSVGGAAGTVTRSMDCGTGSVSVTESMTGLSANKVVGDTGFVCYNCGQSDHAANDCLALWCSRCGSNFSSLGCRGYHHFSDCPMWNRKRANDVTGEQQPRMMQRGRNQWSQSRSQPQFQQQQPRAQQWLSQFQSRGQPRYQRQVQQSPFQPQRQPQQFQPRGQPQTQRPVTQPQSGGLLSTTPRSRFAGHIGADNNPIFDDALEAAGLQNMTQDEALAFSVRIQSYANYTAASIVQDMSEEEQAGPQEYTQPWEHADSDM